MAQPLAQPQHALGYKCRRAVVVQAGGNMRGGRRIEGPSKRVTEVEWRGPEKLRMYKASDGKQHLGSALKTAAPRPFPGPPPDEGPPLRVLPIGGLGEIGMNCMLVGVRDRYIVIDAGLMFPDFSDLGMQKILPDTSFLHEWKDKIEAVVITHGHEDHIGALPWVVPALDPSTPVYATSFVMQLVKRRLSEYSLFDEARFKTFGMRERFQAGPFEIEPIRVTHSIPDCCGLIMRSDEGTIVHTGDWKIDETPLDGQTFDRETFDLLSKERVALFMSDSTNVLSPGRTQSEKVVHDSLIQKVLAHQNKGRVIVTQFASNLARLYGVKAAADAAGRKICFVGASLSHYLEAAWQDGRAPFDPKELISPEQLKDYDPNQVLIVSTGSQGEPNAQLSKAAKEMANQLKILPSDLLLYSAKVIPGNEPQVSKMLNSLALLGARVVQGRGDNLHTSGHAYQEELKEVMRLVKPQHFLPVHGEYAFLTEHARLAREEAGVKNCSVIKNGQMLGVQELSSRNQVSSGSMAKAKASMSVIGRAELVNYYNDGGNGTGTMQDMALAERSILAFEGIVVVSVDLARDSPDRSMRGQVRLTTRGMWTNGGQLKKELYVAVMDLLPNLPSHAASSTVERAVVDAIKRAAKKFNGRKPEVICIVHEADPRLAHVARVAKVRGDRGDRPPRREASSPGPSPAGWGGAISDDDVAPSRQASSRPWERSGAPAVTRLGGDVPSEASSSSDDSPAREEAGEGEGGKAAKKGRGRRAGSAGDTAAPSSKQALIDSRKELMAAKESADGAPKKRGRPPSRGPRASTGPGELIPVDEEFLAARRAANPRDNNPAAAGDPDNLAYD